MVNNKNKNETMLMANPNRRCIRDFNDDDASSSPAMRTTPLLKQQPASKLGHVYCKYDPTDDAHAVAWYELGLSETDFNKLTGWNGKQKLGNQGKVLLACLDKSGSMDGRPMDSVKIGAKMIAEKLLASDDRPFERFITMLYDNKCFIHEPPNVKAYKDMIESVRANNGTTFSEVFNWIDKFVDENGDKINDLTILYFTDGFGGDCDKEMSMVTQKLQNHPTMNSRFLSIGFSSSHDANFMNKVAKAGKEVGNFFYIDTDVKDFEEAVRKCLTESIDIAINSD